MSLSRRDTIRMLLGGSAAAVAAPSIYVAGRYLVPPDPAPSTVRVATLDELQQPRVLKVGTLDAIVMRSSAGQPRAFSLRCTHAACNVNWIAKAGTFVCPCHGGVFDRDGRVLEGPPKQPLDALQVELRGDDVYVSDILVPSQS